LYGGTQLNKSQYLRRTDIKLTTVLILQQLALQSQQLIGEGHLQEIELYRAVIFHQFKGLLNEERGPRMLDLQNN
jgi:hypothetical protein